VPGAAPAARANAAIGVEGILAVMFGVEGILAVKFGVEGIAPGAGVIGIILTSGRGVAGTMVSTTCDTCGICGMAP